MSNAVSQDAKHYWSCLLVSLLFHIGTPLVQPYWPQITVYAAMHKLRPVPSMHCSYVLWPTGTTRTRQPLNACEQRRRESTRTPSCLFSVSALDKSRQAKQKRDRKERINHCSPSWPFFPVSAVSSKKISRSPHTPTLSPSDDSCMIVLPVRPVIYKVYNRVLVSGPAHSGRSPPGPPRRYKEMLSRLGDHRA